MWAKKLTFGNSCLLSNGGHAPEIIRYLNAIRDFWGSLPQGSADPKTVENLHLRCPGIPMDKKRIEGLFTSGLLFPKLSPEVRKEALDAVLSTSFHMIPTLRSQVLCQNCRYFNTPVFLNLKRLTLHDCSCSLESSFSRFNASFG